MKGDADRVRRAVAGDRAAIRELVARLLPVIRARAATYLRGAGLSRTGAEVDDLVHTIWLRLFEDDARLLRAWDPSRKKSLEGYVGMLSQRELWVMARAAHAQKRDGDEMPLDEGTVATDAPLAEDRTHARDALGRLLDHLWEALGARGREVLVALYVDGLSPAQAAERLGVTTQVVYNWQHKVRAEARRFLEEDLDDPTPV